MLNRQWALLFLLSGTLSFAAKPTPQAQELFIPYWTSEPGWNTELQLRNNLPSTSLTVTPVLRTASGQEIALTPMIIPANDSVSLLVSKAVREQAPDLLGNAGSYGSVVFRYTSVGAMALHARAIVMLDGHPIAVPIRAHSTLHVVTKSGSNEAANMEGIWWQPRAGLNDFLVISNSSHQKANGNLSLFDANGKGSTLPVVLGPLQTERLAINDLLQKSGLSGAYGGITLQFPPSVDVVHFMYDETVGTSASMEMFRRDPNLSGLKRAGNDSKQSTLRAPMLALAQPDPAVGLPPATVLQPTILVRNTTAKSISAEIALNWHGASGSGQAKLPSLQFAPFATQQLQISEMQTSLRIPNNANWASATITTAASSNDLIAIASSRDTGWRYGVDAKFISGDGGYYSGGRWRIDANHNEIAVITNVGTKLTDALLTLYYDGGKQKYEMQKSVGPGDQMWVNLAQLVGQRVPDRKGSLLPLDVGSVTYDLRDLTPRGHNLIANELAVNNTFGPSVIPDCPECCTAGTPFFDPDSLELFIGASDPVAVDQVNSCSGGEVNITDEGTDWGSDDTAVATMSTGQATGVGAGSTTGFVFEAVEVPGECACNKTLEEVQLPVAVQPKVTISGSTYLAMLKSGATGGGNTTTLTATGTPSGGTYSWTAVSGQGNVSISNANTQSATIQSVAVGTYTVQVTYTLNNQPATASTVGRVQQPGSLGVVSNDTQDYECSNLPGQYTTQERLIQYQVLDTSSPPVPVQAVSMSASETLSITSPNTCDAPDPTPTVNAKTGNNGYFPAPDMLAICSPTCLPANGSGDPTGSCTRATSQIWTVNGYTVKSDTPTFTCPGPPTGAP